MEHLRQLPHLRNAFIVFIPENNYAFEAERFAHHLQSSGVVRPGEFVTMAEDENRYGVRTDNLLKLSMAAMLRRYLEFPAFGKICFHRNFFTLGRYGDVRVGEAERLRITIVDQLRRWMRVVIPPRDPMGEPTIKFTGKMMGQPDDLCIALQLAMFLTFRFFSSDKYREFRHD